MKIKKQTYKVGDRVRLIDSGRYNTLKPHIGVEGVIKDTYEHGMLSVEFDINIDGHDCSGICKWGCGWNVHENQIQKIEDKPMKKYKLTGKYTLKNIMEDLPYEEEFNNFCKELIEDGWSYKDLFDNDITFTDKILEFDSVKNNIDWAIEKGFVEEVKEFEPFDLTIHIDSKEMLEVLYGTVNTPLAIRNDYENLSNFYSEYEFKIFDPVANEMHRIK